LRFRLPLPCMRTRGMQERQISSCLAWCAGIARCRHAESSCREGCRMVLFSIAGRNCFISRALYCSWWLLQQSCNHTVLVLNCSAGSSTPEPATGGHLHNPC
jgi:hypothetical protein